MRRASDKKEAIALIYKAIGFEGEAGLNLDALADVLSAWGTPVRVRLLYWNGFAAREPRAASGIMNVLDDVMAGNRCLVFAYCPAGRK